MDESVIKEFEKVKLTDWQIEALLREEIMWAIDNGVGWNPKAGADFEDGKWRPAERMCGVCAVGALLIHRQPPGEDAMRNAYRFVEHYSNEANVKVAAEQLGRSFIWVWRLYYAVANSVGEPGEGDPAVLMGRRLREFGDRYHAQREVVPLMR